jgi:hypothetical protein
MKIMSILFCLLYCMGGSAYGDQAAPRDTEGSQTRQGGGSEFTPQGEPRFGPPPEAFKACEGKIVGSTAQFTGPDGKAVTGTCWIADGRLVLRPDRLRENSREGRRGPPPEAYKACEGKSRGSVAQFVNPRGETVKGTCEEEDGKMVLRPDSRRGDRLGQAQGGPMKGRVER